jgi:3,4-dihydroxy-2-butanone 4-phosphate synthase
VSPEGAARVARAIEEIRRGRPVVLRDDTDRGGEGDVFIASEFADAEAINFLVREARGIVCLALAPERCDELGLRPIGRKGPSRMGGISMVSIEAREGVTTGISAADRARTIAVAVDPDKGPGDLVEPGHIFPLRARPGGVLERRGRTEAAVDLATEAGLYPAGVLCEVMREDGRMASGPDLETFAAKHGLSVLAVSEVCDHVRETEPEPPSLSADDAKRLMRSVMGHFATGVSVVTASARSGDAVGTTANAITSVSLDPPLLLACLAEDSETLAAIRETSRFAVNVLTVEQRHHSDRFASKGTSARAHEVEFERQMLGVPVLPDALAVVACQVEAIHPAGDHEIVVGRAYSLHNTEDPVEPLVFYRGGYSRIPVEEDELVA